MIDVSPEDQVEAASRVKAMMAVHRDAEDLLHVGAYVKGSNPEIDQAVQSRPAILKFLKQGILEQQTLEASCRALTDLTASFSGKGK